MDTKGNLIAIDLSSDAEFGIAAAALWHREALLPGFRPKSSVSMSRTDLSPTVSEYTFASNKSTADFVVGTSGMRALEITLPWTQGEEALANKLSAVAQRLERRSEASTELYKSSRKLLRSDLISWMTDGFK